MKFIFDFCMIFKLLVYSICCISYINALRFAFAILEFCRWTRETDNTEDSAASNWSASEERGVRPYDGNVTSVHDGAVNITD